MTIRKWIKDSDSNLAVMLHNAGVWYEDNIYCRFYNLCHWWIYDVHRKYFLEKAVKRIAKENYEVIPDTITFCSWRRLWIPIIIKITMVSPLSKIWGVAIDMIKERNNDWCMACAGNYCWIYFLRNNNTYVVDRMKDEGDRKKHSIKESEVKT